MRNLKLYLLFTIILINNIITDSILEFKTKYLTKKETFFDDIKAQKEYLKFYQSFAAPKFPTIEIWQGYVKKQSKDLRCLNNKVHNACQDSLSHLFIKNEYICKLILWDSACDQAIKDFEMYFKPEKIGKENKIMYDDLPYEYF